MKQHITTEQLNELDDKAKEKLREWWTPKYGDFCTDDMELIEAWETDHENGQFYDDENKTVYDDRVCYPLLSIGQMIEFIIEEYGLKSFIKEDLCGALWEACKYILNQQNELQNS